MKEATLLNAMDWVKTHGYDFWKQFSAEEWAIARKAVAVQVKVYETEGKKISDRTALRLARKIA